MSVMLLRIVGRLLERNSIVKVLYIHKTSEKYVNKCKLHLINKYE